MRIYKGRTLFGHSQSDKLLVSEVWRCNLNTQKVNKWTAYLHRRLHAFHIIEHFSTHGIISKNVAIGNLNNAAGSHALIQHMYQHLGLVIISRIQRNINVSTPNWIWMAICIGTWWILMIHIHDGNFTFCRHYIII